MKASQAPIGDVAAALLQVDSLLMRIKDPERAAANSRHEKLLVPGAVDFKELVDGFCTLIYVFMTWLRQAHEDRNETVLDHVIPDTVAQLQQMTKSVAVEAIPTMAAMMTAAALGLSPNLWREQYGPWMREELTALEANAVILAERINTYHGDDQAALRMVSQALTALDDDPR